MCKHICTHEYTCIYHTYAKVGEQGILPLEPFPLSEIRNSHFFLISLCLFKYIIFELSIFGPPHLLWITSTAPALPPWVQMMQCSQLLLKEAQEDDRILPADPMEMLSLQLPPLPKMKPHPHFPGHRNHGLYRLSRALHQRIQNVNLKAGVWEDLRVLRRMQEALGLTSSTPWARNGGA